MLHIRRMRDLVALVVDDMWNLAFSIQENCTDILHVNIRMFRSMEAWGDINAMVAEERICTDAVSYMALDFVVNVVGGVAFVAVVLLSHVIWELTLIKINLSIFTIPYSQIF